MDITETLNVSIYDADQKDQLVGIVSLKGSTYSSLQARTPQFVLFHFIFQSLLLKMGRTKPC